MGWAVGRLRNVGSASTRSKSCCLLVLPSPLSAHSQQSFPTTQHFCASLPAGCANDSDSSKRLYQINLWFGEVFRAIIAWLYGIVMALFWQRKFIAYGESVVNFR